MATLRFRDLGFRTQVLYFGGSWDLVTMVINKVTRPKIGYNPS